MENWRNVVGYEGLYMVSDLGNVRSLDRIGADGRLYKGKLKKQTVNTNGYLKTGLTKEGYTAMRTIHQLVCESFLGHIPNGYESVVNHKDFNKTNNSVDNLEIVSNRENSNRKHLLSTSKYVGVYWDKNVGKWKSQIVINGNRFHLGYFEDEEEAGKAYEVILFLHNKGFKFKSAKQCREVLDNDWVKLPFNDTEPFFIIAA